MNGFPILPNFMGGEHLTKMNSMGQGHSEAYENLFNDFCGHNWRLNRHHSFQTANNSALRAEESGSNQSPKRKKKKRAHAGTYLHETKAGDPEKKRKNKK